MNGEVEEVCVVDELLLPLLHRSTSPARHRILIYRLALVGDNQILVNARNLTVALTHWAGTNRVVEAEEMLRRLLELYAVSLKA